MEFTLITLFFRNIGKVLTTSSIIREIWGVGTARIRRRFRALMAGLRRK